MKKITSVLLTMVMLLSMLSATASAMPGNTCVEAAAYVNYENRMMTVAFTAAQSTTNGKITVEYDAGSLTYVDCNVIGTTSSVSQEAGTVTFGYAESTANTIRTGRTIATLTLRIDPNASGTTELKVNVDEFNGTVSSVGAFTVTAKLTETLPDEPTPDDPTPDNPTYPFYPIPSTPQPAKPPVTDPAPVTPDPGVTEPVTGPVTTGDTTENGAVVTETTATIESTTEGDTASATVSQEIADEIIEQAVRNGSDTVVIAPQMGNGVNEAEVSVPAELAADIAEKTNAALRIETPVASVTIPHEGLSSLAAAGGEVTVSAKRDGSTVTVTISANGQQVNQVSGGVKVSVPQNCTPGTVAMLVREDGSTEIIRMSVASKDGQSVIVPLNGSAKVMIVDNSQSFTDVAASSWAANAVAFVSSHELMKGTGDGVFDPDVSMTRGMLAVVLHNLENNAIVGGGMSFGDVADNTWYANAVAWAAAKGIITGYPDGSFGPNDSITREQLAVMLYRYAGNPTASTNGLNFTDADKISGYAQQAIAWAVANGVMNGKGGGILDPQGTATRAEVAQMLLNFVSSMA